MSLSSQEEQVLSTMEDGLARSDPELASLLAIFGRLTSGEELPVREKILAARRRDPARRRRCRYRDSMCLRARRLYMRPGFRRTALLWLAAVAAVALFAVALVVGRHGSAAACTPSWSAACTAPVPAHSSRSAARKAAAGQALRPAGQVPLAADPSAAPRRQG